MTKTTRKEILEATDAFVKANPARSAPLYGFVFVAVGQLGIG
ncbi:hypothetical protein [Mesorhizobium sp. M0902]